MSITEAYRNIKEFLLSRGIENALFEAKQLICFEFAIREADLLLGLREISDEEYTVLLEKCVRRAEGYPLQYLLGEWEFYGLPFYVGPGVLIPRQDTECLCDAALELLHGKYHPKIIDLCSGSGCIAVVLEQKSKAGNDIYALEKSKDALSYMCRNIELHQSRVHMLHDDVLFPQTLETDFDLIVSNPPYLTREDMQCLQKEVCYEPPSALYGYDDGLHFYREIARIWKQRLKAGGALVFELGIGQQDAVAEILMQNGFCDICHRTDLCGIIRVVYGVKAE